ncbi:hypothetical protein EYF80_009851 [Liparis tanakae]|uniref:Uncharacterized protein n=1 Tax=Liparis tanakae TaxID=230148 RepID=A0A4Z2IQL1_9TELE|nr:hypothetical protein EYF80_009851 [Liparis tanakae]
MDICVEYFLRGYIWGLNISVAIYSAASPHVPRQDMYKSRLGTASSVMLYCSFWNRASPCCEALANFQLQWKTTQVGPSCRVPRQEVGTSHLRSLADGIVDTPADLSVGFLSVPGACASHLLMEVRNATVHRTPDVVVLLAPGNDLTGYKTVSAAGADFAKLLNCLVGRWTEVHLSDDSGMPILANQLWRAARLHLQRKAPAVPMKTAPPLPSHPPKVAMKQPVVEEEGEVPQQTAPKWQRVGPGNKRFYCEEPEDFCSPKRTVVHQQAIKECFIPLSRLMFSTEVLAAMNAVVPSHLPSPKEALVVASKCTKVQGRLSYFHRLWKSVPHQPSQPSHSQQMCMQRLVYFIIFNDAQ